MSKLTKAISEAGQVALKSYANVATMVTAFEQSIQYTGQIFYCIAENKFYRYKGTTTNAIADYDEITLAGDSATIKKIPEWSSTNTYAKDDIIAYQGGLFKAGVAIPTTGGNNPIVATNQWVNIVPTTTGLLPKVPDWSSTYTYGLNDICASGGYLYVSQKANNLNNVPTTDAGTNWKEYRRHFFENAPILDIMRSMGYWHIDDNTAPRVVTQADLDGLVGSTNLFLRFKNVFKMCVWGT